MARDEDRLAAEAAEMRALAAGDSAAFKRLIERESPRLLRFGYAMLGNIEEAEDMLQDTFFSLWQNAAGWTPDARVATWLHRVCYNGSIDRLRRRRNFVDDGVLTELPDDATSADLRLVQSQEEQGLRTAIARLGPRQRTAVLLFHFQDMSQRDAAEVMGVSEDALESLLARARRQLRSWLESEGDEND